MNREYVLLTVKEEMWARMLMEVLKDNHIPYTTLPVYGIGYSIKTGKSDSLQILVPDAWLPRAQELLEAIFPEDTLS